MIVRMRVGEVALELCRHGGVWYMGLAKPGGSKGTRFHYHKQPDFDTALDTAVRYTRAWRARGWKLHSQEAS